MSLADFQTIYWWEYVHRLWGRLIGVVYAVPFLYFWLRGRLPKRLFAPLGGILLLGAAQGALGWYMVESGLADRVDVSQYRLVAHLALALAIYALTLWIALGLFLERPRAGVAARWTRGAAAIARVASRRGIAIRARPVDAIAGRTHPAGGGTSGRGGAAAHGSDRLSARAAPSSVALPSASPTGGRGRFTTETRMKLMIISRNHEPYLPRRTNSHACAWCG